jgi:hypothetical protein
MGCAPEGRKMEDGRWKMGTKPLGSGAVDPATAGPRKGRHGFREEVASNGIWKMGVGILGLSRTAAAQQPNRRRGRWATCIMAPCVKADSVTFLAS